MKALKIFNWKGLNCWLEIFKNPVFHCGGPGLESTRDKKFPKKIFQQAQKEILEQHYSGALRYNDCE